jgi:hypothetical protein
MRSSMLAACLAFVLLVVPAEAQRRTSKPADAPIGGSGERVIMDAVFWALPGSAPTTCLQLPPGRLSMTVGLEDVGIAQPVRYTFAPYAYRADDSPTEIHADVTRNTRTFDATIAGGRYCYAIENEAIPTIADDGTESVGQAQLVAVRMVFAAR